MDADLASHLALLAADALAVGAARRGLRIGCLAPAWLGVALVAAGAAAMPWGPFAVMRSAAWALFLHAPVLSGVAAVAAARAGRRHEAGVAGVLGLGLIGVAADAFLVEPRWLEVARIEVRTDELDRPLRIVVLADFQTDRVGAWEAGVVERAMAERPDLILLPGDYVQEGDDRAHAEQAEAFRALMARLDAPLGVWAVEGNVERSAWLHELFRDTRVRAARNTTTARAGPIAVSALSLSDGFDPRHRLPGEPGFHVAFAHAPDFALSPFVGADLLVAGHTHGGQVQLPLIGPLITLSAVPRAWAAGGATRLTGGRTLVVSRGIGMERGRAPRLRFLCRPQLVVIDVVPVGG